MAVNSNYVYDMLCNLYINALCSLIGAFYKRMLKLKHATNLQVKKSRTTASNQFKIVVIGLPNTRTTHLIHRLLNKQSYCLQTKRFKVYHCTISTETGEWREENTINYRTFTRDQQCVRAVIFEVIATKTILELLYLLIAPEDIVLVVYDTSSLSTRSCMADIDYILNSASSHCSAKCCSSAIHSPHFPLVLMVGICNDFTKCLQVVKFLRDYCHGETFEKHILQRDKDAFHFIGEDGSAYFDNIIPFLRVVILTAAEPVYNQPCPSVYLQFGQAIVELYESRSCLTKIQALVVASQAGIETACTEQLFEHFRNKGIILYYPQVQRLQDKIFISPQMIINLITSVFELSPRYSSLHESYMQRTPMQRKLLVYLLENLDLAVGGHWSFSETSKAGFYHDDTPFIIPSLVNSKLFKIKPEGYVRILYCFPNRFIPKCVFYQLITRLIDWFHSDGSITSQ